MMIHRQIHARFPATKPDRTGGNGDWGDPCRVFCLREGILGRARCGCIEPNAKIRRFRNRIRVGLFAAGGLIALPLAAQVDVYWDGTTGEWSSPTNWAGDQLPGSVDNALISNNGTAQVDTGDAITVDQLALGVAADTSGTLAVTGGSVTATTRFIVGDLSTGVLNLSGAGAIFSEQFYLGSGSGGNGTLNMSGGTMTLTDRLFVGVLSAGTFNLSGGSLTTVGGSVAHFISGSTGTVNLSGGTWSSSGAFIVGRRGTGVLNLSGTGTLTIDDGAGTITLANDAGSSGTLNLTSANATLNAAAITTGLGTGKVVLDSGAGITLSTALSGSLSLEINQGINTLSGNNTHTGATTVNAGALLNHGSFGSSEVTIAGGALLGGTGDFGGLVTLASGAILAPGASPGTITFDGGLTLHADAVIDFELGTTSDLIVVGGGELTGPSSGLVTLNFLGADGFVEGDYTIFDFAGALLNDFDVSDFIIGTGIDGYDFTLLMVDDTLVARASLAAVPEPSACAVITGVFALGLATCRRRGARA
jgi:autotransporter-associated beta strand protein